VKPFIYTTGEDIRKGDRITYHGEPGEVEFVVTGLVGDSEMDWYAQQFPGGGIMVTASRFGNVFVGVDDIDETLEPKSRGHQAGGPQE
jgi:hypothetical protein